MASDERLHNVAGLRAKETTPPSSVLGALADLPNPATGFGHLTDGVALPIHRPLANDYQLPDRGTESHGIDNDIPSDDMTFDDDILTGPAEPYDGPQYSEQLIAPKPVPVAVVSNPIRSELVFTDLTTVIGPDEKMPGFPTAVPRGQLVRATIRQLLPYDDTRTRAEFWNMFRDPAVGVIQNLYTFALSTDLNFGTYIIFPPPELIAYGASRVVLEGKNAIYGCLVGGTAASDAGTGPNSSVLCVNITRRQVVNQTL